MAVLSSLKGLLGTRGVLLCGCAAAAYAQPYRPLVFVGSSMSPTYANGAIAVTVPFDGTVKHGDVVVIERPDGVIVKRIAMIPGDPILRVRTLFGGKWKDAFCMAQGRPAKKNRVKIDKVPEGVVYVLGDNLPGSTDSRSFGPIPVTEITRKVYRPRPGGPGDEFVAVKTYRQMRTW